LGSSGAVPVLEQHGLTTLRAEAVPGVDAGERAVSVQTPQAFPAGPLLAAYDQAHLDGFVGTDTASCMERYTDVPVRCVPGDARNVKITYPEDLFVAERMLARAGWDLSDPGAPGMLREAVREHVHLPALPHLWRRREAR
jgi:2-C-methyl-D-erythritol 4-phosphate cytidylyltransferase